MDLDGVERPDPAELGRARYLSGCSQFLDLTGGKGGDPRDIGQTHPLRDLGDGVHAAIALLFP
ncbi:hypothetical protein JCM25156A_04160 [Komagataeibacter kakiaceti JCM 25156]|uniref:hypothetical protein n=1 Tax=Komagataeibacter kakiaceti TaxID=943261 RepID=UPI00046FA78F|nr:hypothetical protein [Komagataeibacter kakiaceti]